MNRTELEQEIARVQAEHDELQHLCNEAKMPWLFGKLIGDPLRTHDERVALLLEAVCRDRAAHPERYPTAKQAAPRPAPVVSSKPAPTSSATPTAVVTMRAATPWQTRVETRAEWLASPLRARLEALVAEHEAHEAEFDAKRKKLAAKAPAIRLHLQRSK